MNTGKWEELSNKQVQKIFKSAKNKHEKTGRADDQTGAKYNHYSAPTGARPATVIV